ncbi:DUF1659 domain-containing protein [[Clostridium] dakarense]|uniref:DUF1659 domain-containing protein n=1 Tax=Faecalimicrobium dakarense TaxID=1301100 RepID=UPI0004BCEF39|nr:DUF1659 domain-containing protein [[Clostridium] dakarense]
MAVIETKNPSTLKVKLDLGMVNGKTKTKIKSFSNVKPNALAEDIYFVADALMNLQEHNILDVIKQDNTSLDV